MQTCRSHVATCTVLAIWCAGLPVPTQDIVELVQTVLGLMPPAKLAAAVQKLMNCCPEARAALEEQVLSQDSRGTGVYFTRTFIQHEMSYSLLLGGSTLVKSLRTKSGNV